MAEANLLLEAVLERAGVSHAGLAKRLNTAGAHLGLRYDHASVARWIRDHAIPRHPVPDLICRVLTDHLGSTVTLADIGLDRGHPAGRRPSLTSALDQATALWRGDRRGRHPKSLLVGAAATAPVWEWENPPEDEYVARPGERRLDRADVASLRRLRAHYQEMYRRVGGLPVRTRIAAVLAERADPLLRAAYDDQLGRQLYRAVGGLAALAGVCAYDADLQPLAQRHLFTALRLAKASGDRQFGAYIVAVLATQALYLDEHRLVVQYAEAALRSADPLDPALASDLHALAGKAYARMGDAPACHRHLRRSEASVARLPSAQRHEEVSYVHAGLVETQIAEALRRLGDLAAAQAYAEESLRTAASTHLRGQVHRHAGLALILAGRGELDRSVHVAEQMLDRAEGMESGRIRDRVNQVARALRPHASEPAVAAFLTRVHENTYLRGT